MNTAKTGRVPAIRAAIGAAIALTLALAGCSTSPGDDDQVVIIVTNLSGDWWDGRDVYLTLETREGVWPNMVFITHAKGVATVQNGRAVFRMYAADADGYMTAQQFAAAESFYLVISDDACCLIGTDDMVSITTGSQSIAANYSWPDGTWWGC